MRQELLSLSRRLDDCRAGLVFTGAGISTNSGIPDFRGPQGLWKKWKPVYFQEFMASEEARVRHWDYKLAGWKDFREAKPNAAHQALVELERLGRLQGVVTQNIDGLHQLAGQSPERVIELHGTNRRIHCVSCGRETDPDPIFQEYSETRIPPRCPCGGFLKPATVSFGQSLPTAALERAFLWARQADLVLSIGSTLEVEPAASVPRVAQEAGAFYAIINRGPTAHDALADLRIEGDASQVLQQCLEAMG